MRYISSCEWFLDFLESKLLYKDLVYDVYTCSIRVIKYFSCAIT